ncbi:MAG: hypothetical protein ACRDY1_10695 [Acidimicrobiales bacterium]
MALERAYLLTAQSNGELAVGDLTLVLDDVGLTIVSPHGTTASVLPWADLTGLRTDGPVTAPGGEGAVLLEASSATRIHRFAVPTTDVGAFESTIATVTGAPSRPTTRPSRRRR